MPEQSEPRVAMLQDAEAGERERAIFERARRRYGWVPNTIRVMARSGSAAAGTPLDPVLRRAAGKHLEPSLAGVAL